MSLVWVVQRPSCFLLSPLCSVLAVWNNRATKSLKMVELCHSEEASHLKGKLVFWQNPLAQDCVCARVHARVCVYFRHNAEIRNPVI